MYPLTLDFLSRNFLSIFLHKFLSPIQRFHINGLRLSLLISIQNPEKFKGMKSGLFTGISSLGMTLFSFFASNIRGNAGVVEVWDGASSYGEENILSSSLG